jgi:Zn-dependent M28 family amino/carboxypeptidase
MGLAIAVCALASASQAAPPGEACDKRVNNTFRKLLECVTLEGVRQHQAAFQFIADASGGTRASGTPGYDDSGWYVGMKLEEAGYDVTYQEFDDPFFQELAPAELEQLAPIPKVYPYFDVTGFATMTFSGSGDVTGTAEGVDLLLPPAPFPNGSTSGCEADDFAGFTPGNIAIIQRGGCTFALKAANAEAAGAIGVIIFNEGQPGRTDAFLGTLGAPGATVPVVGAAFDVGVELAAGGVAARLAVDAVSALLPTFNVLAETSEGVMVGAHLDSVDAGPGIQDNGSGSAAILEVALQMAKVRPRNKVRFAWWGAEESGLVGSTFYVNSLAAEEQDDIALYLNFDMIGSPNFARFIYDGDGSEFGFVAPPGSDAIEAFFEDFYAELGLFSEPTPFTGGSDYFAFIVAGIPSGGLFTGASGIKTPEQAAIYGGTAGEQYDPCYHLACDTFELPPQSCSTQ